jgi:DNA-binding MarR family transcriptional regulator
MEPSLQQVGQAVKRLQWRHHREANKRLAAIGLSIAQWDVLRNLAAHPDASLHELAQRTFQTDQSMGTMANRMTDRGLIQRVEGPGRAVRHQLTPEGDHLRQAGAELLEAVLQDSLGGLSREDLSTLYRLLTAATG